MSPEVTRNVPPYLQIADALEARITSGELTEGDTIPSARQISADWEVALATATKAHAELRSRGLVLAQPGIGTIVSTSAGHHGAQERSTSSRTRGFIYGAGEAASITAAELTTAPAHVAVALGVEEGAPVIRRERVTKANDVPVSVSTSWLPGSFAEIAPELLKPERVRSGTFRLAAERAGLTVTSGREEAAATSADAATARALQVPEGSPVLLSHNWFRDENGDAIEYGESARRPERWSSHEFTLS